MGDIIIPKKSLGSFMLGIAITVCVLFLVGGVLAATVYNAGGGQLSNLGEPSADSDAATKSYVDSALGATWVAIGSTDCNGGYCLYGFPGTRYAESTASGNNMLDGSDVNQATASKLCQDNGYEYAVAVGSYYVYSGTLLTCYFYDGGTWRNDHCETSSSNRYVYIDAVLCVG